MNEYTDISAERIMNHVKKIVSFGPRMEGSPSSIKTVDYINDCFLELGIEIEKIPMDFPYVENHEAKLKVKDKEIFDVPCVPFARSAITKNKHIEAEAVFVNLGIEKDYEGLDVKGKVVFASEKEYWEGKEMPHGKYYNAFERGALAYVYSYKRDDDYITTWGLNLGLSEIPAVGIPYSYYTQLKNKFGNKPFIVEMEVTGNIIQTKDFVISGKLQGNNSNNDIIFIDGSHHETVMGCPGANDNASGIAIAIELARFFSKRKNRSTFVFISTCAEESGCHGLEKYLTQNKPLVERAKAAFVIDQVAGAMPIIKKRAQKFTNAFRKVSEDLIESTDWLVDMVVNSAKELGYYFPAGEEVGVGGLGEGATFLEYGVPVIFMSGYNTDLGYHTAKDDLKMINANSLKAIADIVANTCIEIDSKIKK